MPMPRIRKVVRTGTSDVGGCRHLARGLQKVPGMEISEGTRLEKALVVAACFPFLMMGLLFLFA
jgi:hypothetical protein